MKIGVSAKHRQLLNGRTANTQLASIKSQRTTRRNNFGAIEVGHTVCSAARERQISANCGCTANVQRC